jgi:hypothetical protein
LVSAGLGLPLGFVIVALGAAIVIATLRRIRHRDERRLRPQQGRTILQRSAAVLLAGLALSIANVNALPDAAPRSLAAWTVVALSTSVPLVGGVVALLAYVRLRIGEQAFAEMASSSRVLRPGLPGSRLLKLAFLASIVVIVIVSVATFVLAIDHITF